MNRKLCVNGLVFFVGFFLMVFSANSLQPIHGPWLWMIAPNEEGRKAADYIDVDSLAIATGGNVTETVIATNGTDAGDFVGNYAWTAGTITLEYNNINRLVNNIGMNSNENIDYHAAYALISIMSDSDQLDVPMGASSDDSIKIWLNGQVVHKHPHERGFPGFEFYQDNFLVNLKKGENLLLVKVADVYAAWAMLVGIDANVTFKLPSTIGETIVTPPPMQDQMTLTTDGLVGAWLFDEEQGTTVADSSGNALHGEVSIGTPKWVEGKLNGAMEFSGSEMVTVPDNDALDLTSFTIAAWIKTPVTTGKWRVIATKETRNPTGRNYGIFGHIANGSIHYSFTSDGWKSYDSSTNITDGTWHHVAATYLRPYFRLYIDGKLDAEGVTDAVPETNDGPLYIGGYDVADFWMTGTIDEVVLYNRALNEAEIGELIENGIVSVISPESLPITEETPYVDATVSISPNPVESPLVDQQFTVDLNLAGGINIAGYQATIQFDDTAIRYVSSANGDFLPSDTYTTAPIVVGNTVTIAAASYAGETSGNGILAKLTFEVVAEKESTIMLTEVLFSNSAGMLTRPYLEDGQIIEPPYLREDVNRDGAVNILDLVYVAGRIGTTERTTADVNRDGSVNVLDLVLVAGSFGKTAAAASLLSLDAGTVPTKTEVESWLKQAQQLNLTDSKSLRGIYFLKQLLLVLAPQETALLANYPNPFNPETWIPYQLSKPTEVTLQIYAVGGNLVRTVSLGHQDQGIYFDRKRAVYWDGKNAIGESVASGIYYYTLITRDFTATRKMLILK